MKNNREKHVGTGLILVGLALLVMGLVLSAAHFRYNRSNEERAQEILAQMNDIISGSTDSTVDTEMQERLKSLYKSYPELTMPVAYIGEEAYVGRFDIPGLGVSLPVLNAYSEEGSMPGRYEGSAYQEHFVIGLCSGTSQLGTLKCLGIGDQVSFTDMDGNCFVYAVTDVEQQEPETEEQLTGDDQLTLIAGASGGQSAMIVRCSRVQEQ
jgi:sortase (surface protein transpeptidase)